MKRSSQTMFVGLAIAIAAMIIASMAIAEPAKDAKDLAAALANIKLPPGWTLEDMQACMVAGTPGKMHEHLLKDVGEWQGTSTMWMAPDTEGAKSDCTLTISPVMDGRFVKAETSGEMPGMGPFKGMGLYGYDNVAGQFVGIWIDNHGTGIMNGTGKLSSDGKTLTWKYNFNCPITKKPAVMREEVTTNGPNSKTYEMFGEEPKSGKEFKMIKIELTRKS